MGERTGIEVCFSKVVVTVFEGVERDQTAHACLYLRGGWFGGCKEGGR